MNKFLSGTICAALVAVACLSAIPVRAATVENSLIVSPIELDVTLTPGESKKLSVNVENTNPTTVQLQIQPTDFDVMGNPTGESGWFADVSVSELVLAPGEMQSVSYTIQPPATADSGDYYIGLRIIIAGQSSAGVASAVAGEVIQRVNVNLSGGTNRAILQFSEVSGPRLVVSGDQVWQTRLQNISSFYARPVVYLQGVRPDGSVIRREVSNPEQQLLQAGAFRHDQLGITAADFAQPGIYTIEALALNANTGLPVLEKYQFLYLPWWMIMVGVVGLIALLGIKAAWSGSKRAS